jgi:N-acetylneuraminic acid mutarotase
VLGCMIKIAVWCWTNKTRFWQNPRLVTNRIRNASAALLSLVCVVTLTSAFNLPNRSSDLSPRLAFLRTAAKPAQQRKVLTLADRVAYQRAIEEVYWGHRIWPKANANPKPPLDKVMPRAQIEKKVEDYLRNSQALEDYWQRPITPDQLQAEMERIASRTKQPAVLREIFAALGNDPLVIAECLAKPVLAERLLTELYAHDQRFHGELKQRAEAELRTNPRVRQMKRTSGLYTEMEWIKSDTAQEEDDRGAERSVKLNRSEWQEKVAKLAAQFDAAGLPNARIRRGRPPDASITRDDQAGPDAWAQIKTGLLSPLQEDDGHYYAVAVTKKGKDRLKLATIAWLKEPLRSWVTRAETQAPMTMAAISSANYALPVISGQSDNWTPSVVCTDDTWTPTSLTNAPAGRYYFTGVWTGSEMIVWGGYDRTSYFNTGGRYNPSTDSWVATSTTGAPDAREAHTVVWTGTEMIVWGGTAGQPTFFNTGGRYNPSTDSWTATSTTNAPDGRNSHTAVWTGSEMIVWGGYNGNIGLFNTGGRYNPNTDSWTATSTTNAPTARYFHTAVWTGSEMIVWGGQDFSSYLNTGGRYNASTDSWTATTTTSAPDGRADHTAVWTGSEMIVWGGYNGSSDVNSGGRYNPGTDSWTATSTTNAPSTRYAHTAVWTSSEMIVWGGFDLSSGNLNTGGRYNPSIDSWTATTTTNAPDARFNHTAVWTGSQMIIWGGRYQSGGYHVLNTGGRYCAHPPPSPCTDDTWNPTSSTNAPTGRTYHTAVWTGSEMIVWGGVDFSGYLNTGGRYNPTIDSWAATSTASAPAGREIHTAVWTGSEMIIWGGYNGSDLNTGGRYNPNADSWTATSTTNAPVARDSHAAVWTGNEMIVWGGFNSGSYFNTGGRYNPSTDNWAGTSTTSAPDARALPTAVWTGSEMIAWGGFNSSSDFNTGGRYNPGTDSWTATGTTNAPDARDSHTAVWTGNEMIVWGGETFNFNLLNTGGRYNPGTDSWIATSTAGAPAARDAHTAVWTSSQMIVWGGFGGSFLNTGGRYNPSTDSWTATSTTGAPAARDFHTAVWTGSQIIIWGGAGPGPTYFNTGGRYCAQSAPIAQSAFSRKTHGGAGTFDVPLPLTGNVGVECRSGGGTNDYQMIINFANPVTVGSASVTSGTGSVSSFSVSGSQVTVNLTGVTNVQRITVTLFGVNDGIHMGDVPVSMGVLVGDVNGNAVVNASDVSLTKSQVGNAVSGSNFREDVNANGTISATDVALVKSNVGTALP